MYQKFLKRARDLFCQISVLVFVHYSCYPDYQSENKKALSKRTQRAKREGENICPVTVILRLRLGLRLRLRLCLESLWNFHRTVRRNFRRTFRRTKEKSPQSRLSPRPRASFVFYITASHQNGRGRRRTKSDWRLSDNAYLIPSVTRQVLRLQPVRELLRCRRIRYPLSFHQRECLPFLRPFQWIARPYHLHRACQPHSRLRLQGS